MGGRAVVGGGEGEALGEGEGVRVGEGEATVGEGGEGEGGEDFVGELRGGGGLGLVWWDGWGGRGLVYLFDFEEGAEAWVDGAEEAKDLGVALAEGDDGVPAGEVKGYGVRPFGGEGVPGLGGDDFDCHFFLWCRLLMVRTVGSS